MSLNEERKNINYLIKINEDKHNGLGKRTDDDYRGNS
jgi:hypothetical protein